MAEPRVEDCSSRVEALARSILPFVEEKIRQCIADAGDWDLTRVRIDEHRIKSQASLARKAVQKGWSFEDALTKAQDLVGLWSVPH